ncbi:hypothetical protein B0T26DRAFT_813336 [Lasiosphaeria miniovina]|uniref:Cerato-platanin n=1 Tax=Lasiosphaeria miniovina TaxID=1954250 RepID=A0AA40AC72_9PEZI|nr:uncharacterized protein B0T26DRAFT_813336 [Lasiosphaeria miniovina]KAK0713189.1 hypothetical protein B0T26DRAFT_813336 [Lasiosphaeria miniovina]
MGWLVLFSALAGAATRVMAASGTVWATPHEQYSSSVGVLGCKVNTDRIAYWPSSVDCTNICISLSYEGRTVHLLRIDQSQGAHDISYDAWNYLYSGYPATDKPTAGGATAMEYADLDPSACADLIYTDGSKLPLSASNSMNFLASCLNQKDSWVGQNHILFNILDPICSWGYDESCQLDWPTANQATCPHPLGTPGVLTNTPVYNIRYPTGQKVLANAPQDGAATPPVVNAAAPNAAHRVAAERSAIAPLAAAPAELLIQ